jgi:hypothetical protein
MPPCPETLFDLRFHLMLLSQEQPFGLVPNFSEEAKPYVDREWEELSEEEAQVLLEDIKQQCIRFFKQETAKGTAEVVVCNDEACDCCTEDED